MIAHPKAPLIIAHHFNGAPGIRATLTDQGWDLIDWPGVLGSEPTDTDVTTWEAAWTADRDRDVDFDRLRDFGKDIALLMTSLIDNLIAKGTIQASEFDAEDRQAYQDIKTIVGRLKA